MLIIPKVKYVGKNRTTGKIFLEGNNGGDYIKITQTKEQQDKNLCNLEVGHCCVKIIDHQVPIEFITSLFCEFRRKYSSRCFNFKRAMKEMLPYSNMFNEERISHIKEA